jgi:hypothetical protein
MPSCNTKTVQFDLISNGQKSGRVNLVLETAGTYNSQTLTQNNSTLNTNLTTYSTQQQGFFTAGKGFPTSTITTTNQTHNQTYKPTQNQTHNQIYSQTHKQTYNQTQNKQPTNVKIPATHASYQSGIVVNQRPHSNKPLASTYQTGFGLRR